MAKAKRATKQAARQAAKVEKKAIRAENKANRRENSPRAKRTERKIARQENRTARKMIGSEARLDRAELKNERVEMRAENAESRNEALSNVGVAALESAAGLVGFNRDQKINVGNLGIGSGSEIQDKVQDMAESLGETFNSLGKPEAGQKDNKMIFVIIGAIVLFFVVKKK